MKKIISVVLTLAAMVALLSGISFAVQKHFSDVHPGSWYQEDVLAATRAGIINGKTKTEFKPEDKMTYAEAIKLAACLHQLDRDGAITLTNGNPWYQPYVDYCMENGIINKKYDYTANATRAGYMMIFAKALPDYKLPAINQVEDNAIPDVKTSDIFGEAVYKLYRAGILAGADNEHNCKPYNPIKRAEIAAIVVRMMDESKRVEFTLKISENKNAYFAKTMEYTMARWETKWPPNVEDNSSINNLVLSLVGADGKLSQVTYDIDGNGIKELFISAQNTIIDAYTCTRDGKLIKLFEDCTYGHRDLLFLLPNGRILAKSASRSSFGVQEVYRMNEEGTALEVEKGYFFETTEEGREYYLSKGYTELSVDEYQKLAEEHYAMSIYDELHWQPA